MQQGPTGMPPSSAVGFNILSDKEPIHKEASYDIDLKHSADKPSSKLKMLWSGIDHIVSVLFGALSPLAATLHYGVNKGALWSSFGLNNTAESNNLRNRKVETFKNDGTNRALEIEHFKANITSELHDVQLDGLIIPQSDSQDYLIVFQPNGEHYENHLFEAQELGKKLNKNIVLFNYRGVGESTGNPTCAQDLIQDGKAICKMLTDKKSIEPEHITLYGHSIGGGVATAVAAKNEKLNLIVDRSFSSLSKAASDIVANKTNRVFGFIAKTLFSYYGWNINTAKILKRINNKVLVLTAPEDDVLVNSRLARSLPKNKENITHFDGLKFENFDISRRRLFFGDTQRMTECVKTVSQMLEQKVFIGNEVVEADVVRNAKTIVNQLLNTIEDEREVATIRARTDELERLINENRGKFYNPDALLRPLEAIKTELNRHVHITHIAEDEEMLDLFAEKVLERFS